MKKVIGINNKVATITVGGVQKGMTIEGGGTTEAEEKDINFYDYDGFRVDSWTLAELSTKTALPTAPDHSSDITWGGTTIPLTFDGWNWTLAELIGVNHSGINVGAMYRTTDDSLYICVELGNGRLSPYCSIGVNGTATIDWGDGTTTTITGTSETVPIDTQHIYSQGGKYAIKVSAGNGSTIGTMGEVTYSKLFWNHQTSTNANRPYIYQVFEIYLPKNNIYFGNRTFYLLRNLNKLAIPNLLTSSIASGNMFYELLKLNYFALPTTAKTQVIAAVNLLYANIISIPYASKISFNSLSFIPKLPYFAGVTSMGSIQYAYILTNFIVPNTVTTIQANTLGSLSSLAELKFEASTPPTVSNVNAFGGLPTDCKILVPSGSLSAYTSATNYPSASTYSYEEY